MGQLMRARSTYTNNNLKTLHAYYLVLIAMLIKNSLQGFKILSPINENILRLLMPWKIGWIVCQKAFNIIAVCKTVGINWVNDPNISVLWWVLSRFGLIEFSESIHSENLCNARLRIRMVTADTCSVTIMEYVSVKVVIKQISRYESPQNSPSCSKTKWKLMKISLRVNKMSNQ